MREKSHYLLQWKDWDNKHNIWYFIDDLFDAMDLVENYESRLASILMAFKRTDKGARRIQTQSKVIQTIPVKFTTLKQVLKVIKKARGRFRKNSWSCLLNND